MNWITIRPGHMCIDTDAEYFRNTRLKNEIIVNKEYKCGLSYEFAKYSDQGYRISHAGLTLWFKSYNQRVNAYEFLLNNKPVPTWESFIGF
jgi:hypothetical protein